MTRTRMLTLLAAALALGVVCVSAAQAQQRGGAGRGFGSRDSLLGLLRVEEVQKEMKLTEEQTAKVKEVVEKLRTELREKSSALEEIEDRGERREKMTALSDEFDGKLREQLRDVIPREQMMRLYQIRLQVRPVLESLANERVAGRLQLTDEQKSKVAEISKDMQAKQSELYGKMRDASDEQRSEIFQKMRTLRSEADKKALGVLTEEQKKAFEEMKGAKFEMPEREGRRRPT